MNEVMNMEKDNPYSFYVVLADGIMEIPQESNLSWITLFMRFRRNWLRSVRRIWNFHEISTNYCIPRSIAS